MTPERIVELRALAIRVGNLGIGGCTCNTKPPDIEYHHTHCRYRVVSEAATALIEAAQEVETLRTDLEQQALLYENERSAREATERRVAELEKLEPLFNAVRDLLRAKAFSEPTVVIDAERKLLSAYKVVIDDAAMKEGA